MIRILIVDDDPVFRTIAEKALQHDGEVRTVGDSNIAAKTAAEFRPDLIILDYHMPDVDGLDVFARLQAQPVTAGIPVWMCSAEHDEDTMARAYTLGIQDYIRKPISPKVLKAKVSNYRTAQSKSSRIQESLAQAEKNVLSLMKSPPAIPKLDIGVVYQPHEVVGGDFYDFFETVDANWAIVLGDVTGHGIEAAVLQTMARKVVQLQARQNGDLREALIATNDELVNDLPGGNFVALILAEWHPDAGMLQIYRMGVPHPLFRSGPSPAEGTAWESRLLMSGGTILGLHPTNRFPRFLTPIDVTLAPGDVVLLHSDGAIEASNTTGTDFGFEGLRKALAAAPHDGAQAVAEACRDAVREATGGVVSDDVTFIVLQRQA